MFRVEWVLRAGAFAVLTLPAFVQAAEKGPARTPEALFRTVGCRGCHGAGAPYHASLVASRDKDLKTLTQWILTPQKLKPGVAMPNYEGILSAEEATGLAEWIKMGNPAEEKAGSKEKAGPMEK